jgi:hypothetical protein
MDALGAAVHPLSCGSAGRTGSGCGDCARDDAPKHTRHEKQTHLRGASPKLWATDQILAHHSLWQCAPGRVATAHYGCGGWRERTTLTSAPSAATRPESSAPRCVGCAARHAAARQGTVPICSFVMRPHVQHKPCLSRLTHVTPHHTTPHCTTYGSGQAPRQLAVVVSSSSPSSEGGQQQPACT